MLLAAVMMAAAWQGIAAEGEAHHEHEEHEEGHSHAGMTEEEYCAWVC